MSLEFRDPYANKPVYSVPFSKRLINFASYYYDSLLIALFYLSIFLVFLLVYLVVFRGEEITPARAFLTVAEVAIICRVGWRTKKNRDAVNEIYNYEPSDLSREQQDNLYYRALLELNEDLWLAEERKNGNNPNWQPFEQRCRTMVEAQKTNEGVAMLERGVLELDGVSRKHFINIMQQMWAAQELRIQFLVDAVEFGECNRTYAREIIKKSQIERDALVAIEIYARQVQILEHIKGTIAYLRNGTSEPRLRKEMWRASQFYGLNISPSPIAVQYGKAKAENDEATMQKIRDLLGSGEERSNLSDTMKRASNIRK